MKRYRSSILATAGCLLALSCDSNASEDPTDPTDSEPIAITLTTTEAQIATKSNSFAVDFFAALHERSKDAENIVASPFSLSMALAMVWNGAGGETKREIQAALGLGSCPEAEVNAYFKKLHDALLKTDPSTTLAIANSIWTKAGFPVRQSFYDVNKTWYNAEAQALDFLAPSAVTTINKWCADNTNELIKEIISEISPETVMFLINAVYFNGTWSNKFDAKQTSKQPFTKEDGTTVTVDMMFQRHTVGYHADEHLALTSLSYGNGAFSMLFALPNPSVTFDAMLAQLAQPDYFEQSVRAALEPHAEVKLFIPKFKVEHAATLNETLQSMGMLRAFGSGADFSGISEVSLMISKVLQKAYIDVNEKGTEAAAVTVISIDATSAGPTETLTFRADRPFLFAIRENSTGAILFIGKIGNPAG
jgi:serpin B